MLEGVIDVMISKKFPQFLREQIYDYIVQHKHEAIELTTLMAVFQEQLDEIGINDADKIKALKTIRRWRYNPPKRYANQEKSIKMVKKQHEVIKANEETLSKLQEKTKKETTRYQVVKAKIQGYEQAMYLQKRCVGVLSECECEIKDNLDIEIKPNKAVKYDLLDANLIMLAIRSFGEIKNGQSTEFSRLFFDVLKEPEKATMFLQQNNNFMQEQAEPQLSLADILKKTKDAV